MCFYVLDVRVGYTGKGRRGFHWCIKMAQSGKRKKGTLWQVSALSHCCMGHVGGTFTVCEHIEATGKCEFLMVTILPDSFSSPIFSTFELNTSISGILCLFHHCILEVSNLFLEFYIVGIRMYKPVENFYEFI